MVKIIEQDGKKRQIFDPNNPEDMKLAAEMAKKQLESMEGKTNADKEVEKFKSKAELEEENQQLKEKIQLVAEQAFEAKKRKMGCNDPEIDSLDKLEAWKAGKDTHGTFVKEGASGSLPLSPEQIAGGVAPKGSFESVEALVDHLRNLQSCGTAEQKEYAKQVLDKLMLKWAKGMKEQPMSQKYEDLDWFKRVQNQKRKEEMAKRHINPEDVEYQPRGR